MRTEQCLVYRYFPTLATRHIWYSTQCSINYEVYNLAGGNRDYFWNLWALSSFQGVLSLILGSFLECMYWPWLNWYLKGASKIFDILSHWSFTLSTACPVHSSHLGLSGPSGQVPHDWSWPTGILLFLL